MCSEACAQLASGHRRGGGGVLLTLHELGQLKVFGRLPLRERLLSIRLRTGRRRCSAKNVYPSLWQNVGRCTLGVAAFCHEYIENLLAFCGHPGILWPPSLGVAAFCGRVLSRMYREFVGILWPPTLGVAAFCGRVHPSGWPRFVTNV